MLKVVNGKKVGFVGINKIYVGRDSYSLKGSILKNKFRIGKDGNRDEVVEKYRKWLWIEFNKKGEVYEELVRISKRVIEGENIELVCWCKDLKCHGDIIKSCVEWMIREKIVF
ncbi:MAG: DUF4326 domain-containing protein [Xenococcus sp. (in: cyanobacteria)]